jgi:integration host factor subunit beta
VTKSELITALLRQSHLSHRDVELAVSTLLEHMSQTLAHGERIEIRGFGSFSVSHHRPRTGRNPATGDTVPVEAKYVPRFRPGKALRERVTAT